jgi:single-stranded-DNA-specific exonuclease
LRSALALSCDSASDAFLGVTHSLTGRRWRARLADERAAYALAQAHGLPELLARILAGRGVGLDDVPAVLEPSLRAALPDPSCLADMDKAAERMAAAIIAGEPIVIFGDYDVDGATSSALLKRFCEAAGGRCGIYIPDRIKEGYGPNTPALLRLAEEGAKLVVTVDCGTLSFAPLEAARGAGLDVIVVDHHQADEALPAAYALVNPNRPGDTSGQGVLAAVGVAFLLAVAVNRALRQAGHYERTGRAEPALAALLDLVALGTVCDVVPLTGLNRVFVARGLKTIAEQGNVGLKALAEVARLAERPTPFHLGFLLGPRVNAGGRVGESDLGARLLTTEDPAEARAIAASLDRHNQERQAIEQIVLEAAISAVEAGEGRLSAGGPIVLAGEGWHPGVIGIVASRLKERYGRPVLVIGFQDGIGKGSGRSIAGVDLGAAVREAAGQGLLLAGGGHAMAAGLTVAEAALPGLREHLESRLAPLIARAEAGNGLAIDGLIEGRDGAREAFALAERGAPYGAGFPEPVFALAEARIAFAGPLSGDHLALQLETPGGGKLRAVAFRAARTSLGSGLFAARGRRLHFAGRLKPGWRGGAPELTVEDASGPL